MENKRRWRVFFVWGLFIFSLLYCLPTMFGDALPEGYRNVFAKKLNYGLDLQGGLELRYTVDWKKAIEQNGEKLGETIRQAVIDKLITAKSGDNPSDVPLETRREFEAKYGKDIRTEVTEYQTIVVSLGAEVDSLITAEEILEFDPRYGMGSSSTGEDGMKSYQLILADAEVAKIRTSVVGETQKTLRKRVEAFGLIDPDVRVAGDSDIAVQIPGVDQKQMDVVRQRMGQTAQLAFHKVDENETFLAQQEATLTKFQADNPGKAASLSIVKSSQTGPYVRGERKSEIVSFINELTKNPQWPAGRIIGYEEVFTTGDENQAAERFWRTYLLHSDVEVSGEHLARANVQFDEQGPYTSLDLNAEGGRLFGELTKEYEQRYVAIVLDDDVESAPIINEPILGGRVAITGGRGGSNQARVEEARSLVKVLNQGAYQAPVYKVQDHEVGPSLGADSVEAGKLSLLVGLALVIVFMLLTYMKSGMIAVTVLLFNILLVLMLLVSFNSALTLPGMAGIILTIGMAVDANIIIYERIREEITAGRSPRAAVDAGYEKAMSTILDANITTALAGIILLNYTSGTIRGFAVTLLMGIVCSVFTAVYVARMLFKWYLESRRPQTLSI